MKTSKPKKTSSYISEEYRKKVRKGFEQLGIHEFVEYTDALRFSDSIEKVSILRSEGLKYSISSTTV